MHDKLMRVIVNTDAANLIPIIMNITNTSTAPAPSPPPGAKYQYRRAPPPPPPPPLLSMDLPAVNITYTFIIPTNRACGLPQCDVNPDPVPEGEYVIYKPPLRRQECPGSESPHGGQWGLGGRAGALACFSGLEGWEGGREGGRAPGIALALSSSWAATQSRRQDAAHRSGSMHAGLHLAQDVKRFPNRVAVHA